MPHLIDTGTTPLKPWDLLVQPSQLTDYLERTTDFRVSIVDLSPPDQYRSGHIAGAIWLDAARTRSASKFPGKLPELDQLNDLLVAMDLHENDHVLVMDAEGGAWSGRFIWMMLSLGFEQVHALDGGRIAWERLGLPLTSAEGGAKDSFDHDRGAPFRIDAAALAEHAAHTSVSLEDLLADQESSPALQVWDTRSAEEFSGRRNTAAMNGHIRGAHWLEWSALLDPQNEYRLRAPEQILAMLKSAGIDPDGKIVTHCQTHHRSGLTFLAGRSLDLDIRAYPGSWAEWGNDSRTQQYTDTGDSN